jgi:hypothetical protein
VETSTSIQNEQCELKPDIQLVISIQPTYYVNENHITGNIPTSAIYPDYWMTADR